MGHSTVHWVLLRHAQNRLEHATPAPRRMGVRYEKSRPGELLHLDLKYLAKLDNSRPEYEFAAVDDYTREAVAHIYRERSTETTTQFLERVLAQLPYRVEAVMTDNDMVFTMRYAFYAQRQTRFQEACRTLGIAHRLLRPRRPESNGKVERFFRTVDDWIWPDTISRNARYLIDLKNAHAEATSDCEQAARANQERLAANRPFEMGHS